MKEKTWQLLEGVSAFKYYLSTGPSGRAAAANSAYDIHSTGYPNEAKALFYLLDASVLPTTAPAAATRTSAYPNPTTGLLHLPAAGPYTQATVYDATGRLCCQTTLGAGETTLDLRGLAAGVYALRLTGGPATPQQQRVVVAP